ncbi:MAG: hypothetical protein R2877_06215 [Bdellovibrionota bacterium]
METTENIDTVRGFKRTGVIDPTFATQYPKMLGPWSQLNRFFNPKSGFYFQRLKIVI